MSSDSSSISVTELVINRLVPAQAFRIGKNLAKAGDVAGLKKSSNNGILKLECFVHSEKTASSWYHSSLSLNQRCEFEAVPICTCKARKNYQQNQRCCKHTSALLWGYLISTTYGDELVTPKPFRRANMKRFEKANAKLQQQVRYGITWPEIVKRIREEPPKKREWANNYDKFIRVPVEKKKKKRDFRKSEIVEKLRALSLPVSGNKPDLLARLNNAI
jgi:hypothetical protein